MAETYRLAHSYAVTPVPEFLRDARQARSLGYEMLERARHPDRLVDLHLAAAQLCGLMSRASFDMAAWAPALTQARAAHVYAELTGHRSLRVWAKTNQAALAYWHGRPAESLIHVEAALDLGPTGVAAAALRSVEARSWAHLARPDKVRAAIEAADRALNGARGDDELFDGVGGEFAWGPARHAASAGTALIRVGDGRAALLRLREAVVYGGAGQPGGPLISRLLIDIAAAQILCGRLDDAIAEVEPVWALEPGYRRRSLTARLSAVSETLAGSFWVVDPRARELRERIAVFNAEAVGEGVSGS
jgi:hypothetical protein